MTDPLALDNQVCFALYAANRAVTALYRPLLASLGLTYPQYLVMLVLWEAEAAGEPMRVSDLGQRLRLDSGTLTPLLKRLEQAKLVARSRSQQDERVVTLRLTPQGQALRDRALDVPGQMLCRTGLDADALFALRDQLKALLSQLEQPRASSAQ